MDGGEPCIAGAVTTPVCRVHHKGRDYSCDAGMPNP